ncbi:hypothetical protein pb186bvf_012143 [Paramecium bursaria]
MDSDEERKQAALDRDLPAFKVRCTEFNQKQIKEIVRQFVALQSKNQLDKDICVELVKWVKAQPQYKQGDGEWQCIIGTNFGCSLSYDLGLLTFFDCLGKSVLIFKSG